MANLMPLVHQASRTIRNRQEGNPFTTDQLIADLIEALGTLTSRRRTSASLAQSKWSWICSKP